jgi:GH25 family lysozyme M1 (1,4-beta-N-acetylmuramidase)
MEGLYLSKWQGRQVLVAGKTTWQLNCDLAALKAVHPDLFIWIKATQGETAVDPLFDMHRQKVTEAGFPCGAFHYLTNRGDPKKQAAHFWNVAGGRNHGWTLLHSADVEDPDYQTRPDLADHVYAFFQEMDGLWGARNIPYTRGSYWNAYVRKNARSPDPRFAGYQWWIAHYNTSIAVPALPVDAPTWAIWQKGERPAGAWPGLPCKTTIEVLNPQLSLADISFPVPDPQTVAYSFLSLAAVTTSHAQSASVLYDNLALMFKDWQDLNRVASYSPLPR